MELDEPTFELRVKRPIARGAADMFDACPAMGCRNTTMASYISRRSRECRRCISQVPRLGGGDFRRGDKETARRLHRQAERRWSSTGRLAKTDAIDAMALAQFAAAGSAGGATAAARELGDRRSAAAGTATQCRLAPEE